MRSNIKAAHNVNEFDPQYVEIRDRWQKIAAPDWGGQI
jgi:uncharacterized protein YutD